jgi:AcrR family transcriptional regulator
MSTRSYESALRTEQARLTRARILDAARSLLLARGYQAMTIAALARAADVSTQTIYNAVGGKAAVIKAAYDVALAGDDEAMPMSARPEFAAMTQAADAPAMLRAYAAFSRRIGERVGPLLAVLLANADDDVRACAATFDGERLRGNGTTVAHLAERFGLPTGMTRQQATDIVWALTAPELFDRLVRQRGWSPDRYERWLGDAMTAALVNA